jgi:hypothetical protein
MTQSEAVDKRVRWYMEQGVDYETAVAIIKHEWAQMGCVSQQEGQ